MSIPIRFYKAEYPQVNEVVMTTVHLIQPDRIEVLLPEYNNIKATAELKQLSYHVGEQLPATVIRLNQPGQPMEVSMIRTSAKDAKACNERFAKAKIINKLINRSAVRMKQPELYERIVWHFEAKFGRKNAAYDVFERTPSEPNVLDECNLDMLTKSFLLYFIKEELAEQKRCLSVDVKCFIRSVNEEGTLDAALQLVLNKFSSSTRAHITALGSAKYRIALSAENASEGRKRLCLLVERIRSKVLNMNGYFQLLGSSDETS